MSTEDAEALTPQERQKIESDQQALLEAAQSLVQRQQEIERQLSADVRQVERAFADRLISPLLSEIADRYASDKLRAWLERLKAHFLLNLDRFRRRADRFVQQLEPLFGEPALADLQERFFEYQVNLVVDNSQLKHAPVVVEAAPNYRNLFGTIERVVDRFGRVVTNFTRIKAGSLLQANGGYLVFDILDALAEPYVWKELKRTLKRGSSEIEIYDPFALFTISGLKPQPIPLNIKLVVVGSPLLYHLLYLHDDEFREIFRIKADFETQIAPDLQAGQLYGQLVRKLSDREGLRPFDAAAVAELVRSAARLAEYKDKLTAEFSRICDLAREADFWAAEDRSARVTQAHVRKALAEQVYRSDLVACRIRELIADGTLLVDLQGAAVGQVNGLAVADLGDYAFAWPSRVTASVGVGTAGLINIERESHLSSSTFDKGMLILEGYLRNKYGRKRPLALTASLAMEQSYGGVEGDSASVAELLALLSAIAGVPLRQDVAMTGSINQWGRVQAIAAVNQKIEGFFDICRQLGLTGKQGVCIPAANVRNLVLRQDVVEAVEQGQFHVWPIENVDQALALASGLPAGDIAEEGSFHGRIARRLRQMSALLRKQRAASATPKVTAERIPTVPSPDPRPPLPGRG
jgi:ATP-dependent Lon protease